MTDESALFATILSDTLGGLTNLERALAEHVTVVSIGAHDIGITVGRETVGAYSDRDLFELQKGLCICEEPLAITADGAVDGTYSHVVTDMLNMGGTMHGKKVDSTLYRYGLVALSHGACNSRHHVAKALAKAPTATLFAALTYSG